MYAIGDSLIRFNTEIYIVSNLNIFLLISLSDIISNLDIFLLISLSDIVSNLDIFLLIWLSDIVSNLDIFLLISLSDTISNLDIFLLIWLSDTISNLNTSSMEGCELNLQRLIGTSSVFFVYRISGFFFTGAKLTVHDFLPNWCFF